MKLRIIQIVLLVIALVLAYLIYETIMRPVRFNQQMAQRNQVVIELLKDIRTSQNVYRQVNNRYAGTFDSLLMFLENGQIPVIKMTADPNDTTFTKAIIDTVGYVKPADSLFKHRPGFKLADLNVIPFSEGEKMTMKAGKLDRGGVRVDVFEVIIPKRSYLKGLDENLINRDNVKDLILGSMTEPTTDGNWE